MNDYALYRLPYASQAFRIDDEHDEALTLYSTDGLVEVSGFMVAPFAVASDTPIVVIRGKAKPVSLQRKVNTLCIRQTEDRISYADDFYRFHEAIMKGRFSKLVLSRYARIDTDENIDAEGLFAEACRQYPRQMIALVSTSKTGTWLVATPEILVSKISDRWQTMALAGTMAYNGTMNYNWSEKNIAEQKIVADYIGRNLALFASDIQVTDTYTVRAGNLVHLRSDFSFAVGNDGNCNIGKVVDTLHPTPAVCGLPKQQAMEFILENETYERRYYSGYLGPWNVDGMSSLFVTLRCMEIKGKNCILHAGGGLLRESQEQSEWNETDAKMNVMRNLMYPTITKLGSDVF